MKTILRRLERRLERLEETTRQPSVEHVITGTNVTPDGAPTGDGYRIEGPFPNGDWRRTSLSYLGKGMKSDEQ